MAPASETELLRFNPERIKEGARAGEGHAHRYIDDKKHARLYGDWFHLPAGAIGSGEHTLLVTLNANEHTVWAVDGKAIRAA